MKKIITILILLFGFWPSSFCEIIQKEICSYSGIIEGEPVEKYIDEFEVKPNSTGGNDTIFLHSTLVYLSPAESEISVSRSFDFVKPLGYLPKLKLLTWCYWDLSSRMNQPIPPEKIGEIFGGMVNLELLATRARLVPQFANSRKLKTIVIRDCLKMVDTIPYLGLLNKTLTELDSIGVDYDGRPPSLRDWYTKYEISANGGVLFKDSLRNDGWPTDADYTICWFPRGRKETKYTVTSTTLIYPYAFYYTNIKEFDAGGHSLRAIGAGAFAHSKVQTVTLGKNVEEIGDSAFWACDSLTTLTLNGDTPPTVGPNTFPPETYKRCTLVVPKASYTKYAGIAPWNKFHNMFSPAGVEDVATADGEGAAEYYTLMGVKVEEPVAGQLYICRRGSKAEKVVYRE